RADQVRTQDARVGTEHFGMNGVIDERREWLAVRANRLDDVTARVVELFGVVVEGDFPFRLTGRYLQARWPQFSERLVNGVGDAIANEVNVFQIRGKLSFVIGKPVAIRRAVRVCRANQNVLRWDALHFGAGMVAEHGRKAEKIGANDG